MAPKKKTQSPKPTQSPKKPTQSPKEPTQSPKESTLRRSPRLSGQSSSGGGGGGVPSKKRLRRRRPSSLFIPQTTPSPKAKASTSKKKTTIIIVEHCKQCNSFKSRAMQVKKGLEEAVDGLEVVLNPEQPRKGCFEIRPEGGGEPFISLHNMERPFAPMKELIMEDVISDIVQKIT